MNQQLNDYFSESKKYWEPKRKTYNIILCIVTIFGIIMVRGIGQGIGDKMESDFVIISLKFFIAFILANIAYSTAYIPDVLVQFTPLKGFWNYYRWLVFGLGCLLAAQSALMTTGAIMYGTK